MRGDYDEGSAGGEVGLGTNKTGVGNKGGGRDVRSWFSRLPFQCVGQDRISKTESRESLSRLELQGGDAKELEREESGPQSPHVQVGSQSQTASIC